MHGCRTTPLPLQTIVRQEIWCWFDTSVRDGSIPRTIFIFLLPEIVACIKYNLRCSLGLMIRMTCCALEYNADAESSNNLRPTCKPGLLHMSVGTRQSTACCENCCDRYTTNKYWNMLLTPERLTCFEPVYGRWRGQIHTEDPAASTLLQEIPDGIAILLCLHQMCAHISCGQMPSHLS